MLKGIHVSYDTHSYDTHIYMKKSINNMLLSKITGKEQNA